MWILLKFWNFLDSPSVNLENHDFLGYAETNLAQIVSAGHNGLTLNLAQNKSKYYPILPKAQQKMSKGTIVLLSEELVQYKEEVWTTLIRLHNAKITPFHCFLYLYTFYSKFTTLSFLDYSISLHLHFALGFLDKCK